MARFEDVGRYQYPEFLFGMSGMAYGAGETAWGKGGVSSELALLLNLIPRHGTKCLSVSFYSETEGNSMGDKVIKPGPGRRAFYQDLMLSSVTIGITMEHLDLPVLEYRDLLARFTEEGFEHLVPFLHKKGVEFDEARMRWELGQVLAVFRTVREFYDHEWEARRERVLREVCRGTGCSSLDTAGF